MRGLYVGRFQPFHKGHLAAVGEALGNVDELVIGIGSSQHGWTMENPFTAGERMEMIIRSIPENLSNKVVITQIPDVNDYSRWIESVICHSPPFDKLFTLSPTTRLLAEASGVAVEMLKPRHIARFNGTRIRRLMLEGDSWKSCLPPGSAKVVAEIDGVARIKELASRKISDIPSLETLVVNALAGRRLTVALAESCTGGLASSRLVSVPGASKVFLGSVVAYSDNAKEKLLGVPSGLLAGHGAVSEQTAKAMAEGAASRFGSDIGAGITGVSGPDGGSRAKPVGTVYISVRRGNSARTVHLAFKGNRSRVNLDASTMLLKMLLDECEIMPSGGRSTGTPGTRRPSRASKSPRRG